MVCMALVVDKTVLYRILSYTATYAESIGFVFEEL